MGALETHHDCNNDAFVFFAFNPSAHDNTASILDYFQKLTDVLFNECLQDMWHFHSCEKGIFFFFFLIFLVVNDKNQKEISPYDMSLRWWANLLINITLVPCLVCVFLLFLFIFSHLFLFSLQWTHGSLFFLTCSVWLTMTKLPTPC